MEVSSEINELGAYDPGFTIEDTDEGDDEDLCRICRSPEQPGNPLRYPCLCRGSIKFVHQDCLHYWLNLKGYTKCEVCGRSYSFVPVYSENVPERLSCKEFVMGVLWRVSPYIKLIAFWIVVVLLNTYFCSLLPMGQEVAAGFQSGFWMSWKVASLFAGLLYSAMIVCFMTVITIVRVEVGDLNVRRVLGVDFIGNGLQQGVIGGVVNVLWKYTKILCDWFLPSAYMCLSSLFFCLCLLCVEHANTYMDLVREIIQKRAFWYLQDVTEPDYKVTKLNLGYTLFVFASHGVLLVILFHLPIKAVTLISPSFFPLELWITDERLVWGAFAIYLHFMTNGIKLLIQLTKPTIKLIVHNWIITVSSWLQLSDFLLVVPRGDGFHRADQNMRPLLLPRQSYIDNPWVLLYIIAEGSMVNSYGSQNAEDGSKDQRDNRFMLRIALMLVLAALSMFLFSTAFIALPILAGRVFFDSISFIMLRFGFKPDDFIGFWIGCYILRAIYIITCFVSDHLQNGGINMLLRYVLIRIRNGLMFSIWISVIPGLLGLLMELMIIIPYRVPPNDSPTYFLIQDWFVGVVVLHSWTFMTMLTPIKWFATDAWQEKLEKIRNLGINGLPTVWLLRDVIGSIISTLVTTLSIPYLLVKSLFPLLGFSQSINSTVERFTWPALLALIAGWFVAKLTRDLIVYLHQLVFNERYLVGERLDNLIEG
ncbi:hypothetical protein AALP_AA1G098200 [Arabis alpina]|uniref:RING-CH-type domain-containing protein n=1 Tax=Arabis alpina TaxID=50452 RepID=A0A087HM91_ARAAL|nr:hypothetical protein AALP_AA1G098200 [Arabis alpina]